MPHHACTDTSVEPCFALPDRRCGQDCFDWVLQRRVQQAAQQQGEGAPAWQDKLPQAFGRYSPFCIDYLGEWLALLQ